ncbi:MAG: hypothetical protein Q4P29_02970 [Tissierellia bacterium]|nr:hypothetical protein [Tissierellia bacterium]
MRNILLRRFFRDYKNILKYFSLIFLIAIAIFLVTSILGSSVNAIEGIKQAQIDNKLEDGHFSVFLPLSDREIEKLESKNIIVEPNFFLEFNYENAVLRAYKNRENINRLAINKGRIAKDIDEIALEQLFVKKHGLKLGDKIRLGNFEFTLVGTVSSPDYDTVLKELSDVAASSKSFGTAFLTAKAYESLKSENTSLKAEEYVYSYLLGEKITNQELKTELKKITIDPNSVSDKYFKEMYDDLTKDRTEILDSTEKLKSASNDFKNAIKDLDKNSPVLLENLESINPVLSQFGASEFAKGLREYIAGVGKIDSEFKKFNANIEDFANESEKIVDEYFPTEIENLNSFVERESNRRIGGSLDNISIDLHTGIFAGIIIMIMIMYVLSIFVTDSIERENSIIGTLFALGLRRNELILTYTTLPVILSFIGGLLGFLLSITPIGMQRYYRVNSGYFSIPLVPMKATIPITIYALVMPVIIAFVVNWLTIYKKFKRPTLSLLRNEKEVSEIEMPKFLSNKGFIKTFRLKQFWKEKRSVFAVIGGIFIALLLLSMGLNSAIFCSNMHDRNIEDAKFSHMYMYKYPEKEVPKGGTKAFVKTLKKPRLGYNMDVNIIAIESENNYFPKFNAKKKNELTISDSMAKKYHLKIGDKFVLSDEIAEIDYGFTVTEIVDYSIGLTAFMDYDSALELFDKPKDYYNVVYSNSDLGIDPARLYSVTTYSDIKVAAEVFIRENLPVIKMLIISAILIIFTIMYQLIKIMVDRSKVEMAMFKIFGYRDREIKTLYLDVNFPFIVVGTLISIFLAKKIMDMLFEYLVSNVAASFDTEAPLWVLAIIFFAILINYIIVSSLIYRKIKKIDTNEILKQRE